MKALWLSAFFSVVANAHKEPLKQDPAEVCQKKMQALRLHVARIHADFGDVVIERPEVGFHNLKSLDLPGDSAVDVVRRLKICCLSVRELSDIMGTSNSIVYKWLTGETSMPEAYAFPLNQILSDLFTLSANDFLKKHPTHGNLSQRRDQIRTKTSELAELDRKSAKARPLVETYSMDSARDFLDVLSFHEFQTPAPPTSMD